jgi:midasin
VIKHLFFCFIGKSVLYFFQVYDLYRKNFPADLEAYKPTNIFHHGGHLVQIGHSFLKVRGEGHLHKNRSVSMEILHHSLQPLESVMKCVEMNWMAILVCKTFITNYVKFNVLVL